MQSSISSREFRDQIVGKRITGVVARPGRGSQPPVVLMMHFEDGSTIEFVSPRSDQLLRRAVAGASGPGRTGASLAQLELMPSHPAPHLTAN